MRAPSIEVPLRISDRPFLLESLRGYLRCRMTPNDDRSGEPFWLRTTGCIRFVGSCGLDQPELTACSRVESTSYRNAHNLYLQAPPKCGTTRNLPSYAKAECESEIARDCLLLHLPRLLKQ